MTGEEGTVVVRVLVREDGIPTEITLYKTSGYKRLNDAALAAVAGWKFNPAIKDGKPIQWWVAVPIVFKLQTEIPKVQIGD
jgi:protein TonB